MQISTRAAVIVLSALVSLMGASACVLTENFNEPNSQNSGEPDASGGDTSLSVREIIEAGLVGDRWVGSYRADPLPHIASLVVVEFTADGRISATQTGEYVGNWEVGDDFKVVVSDIEPAPDNPIESTDGFVETLTFSPVVNSDDRLEALELDITFGGAGVSQTVSYQRASDATIELSDLQGLWKGTNTATQSEPVVGLRVNSTTREVDLVVFGPNDTTANVLGGHGFVYRADGDNYWGMLPEGTDSNGKPHSAIGGMVESDEEGRRVWLPVVSISGGGGLAGETDALVVP